MFQSKKNASKKHTHTSSQNKSQDIPSYLFLCFFQNPFPITNPKKKNYHTNFQQKPMVSWWTLPCTTVDLDDPTWGCGSLVNGSNSPELWKIHRTINMGFIIISQKISGINMDYHHHIPVYIYIWYFLYLLWYLLSGLYDRYEIINPKIYTWVISQTYIYEINQYQSHYTHKFSQIYLYIYIYILWESTWVIYNKLYLGLIWINYDQL